MVVINSVIQFLFGPPDRDGRSGGARTPSPRFWRPVLYQLSYTPAAPLRPRLGRRARCLPVFTPSVNEKATLSEQLVNRAL